MGALLLGQIEAHILDILQDLHTLCTHCGQCCRDEFFFLSDAESPLIAQKLFRLGGLELVEAHILRNPTVYNRWERYLFHLKESCPFHVNNRCDVYDDRPMVCRLLPFKLVGLFDNHNSENKRTIFHGRVGKGYLQLHRYM